MPYLAMAGVVIGNVAGNVLLKMGANAEGSRAVLLGIFGWQTLAGIACFATAVLLYAWSLKHLPLYLAQTIASLQFAGAILAASTIFGETIRPHQWAGLALILVGLSVVAQ